MKEYQSSPEYRDYKQALMNRYDDQQELYCDFDDIIKHRANQYEKEIEKNNLKKERRVFAIISACCLFLISILCMTIFKPEVQNRVIAFFVIAIMLLAFSAQWIRTMKELMNKKYCEIAYGQVTKMYVPLERSVKKSKRNRPENMVAIVYFPQDNKYVRDVGLQKSIKDLRDAPKDVAVYKMRGLTIAQALE